MNLEYEKLSVAHNKWCLLSSVCKQIRVQAKCSSVDRCKEQGSGDPQRGEVLWLICLVITWLCLINYGVHHVDMKVVHLLYKVQSMFDRQHLLWLCTACLPNVPYLF